MKRNTHSPKRFYHSPYQQKPQGFSVIEFLVASLLSMIVLVAVGSGYYAARKVNDVAGGRLNTQQDIRNTANMIVRDSRMAGSFGCFNLNNSGGTLTQTPASAAINPALSLRFTSGSNTFEEGVKSVAQANFGTTGISGFTPNSEAVIFQYGVGSPTVSNLGANSITINTDNDTKELDRGSPIIVSSCDVLDQVYAGSVSTSSGVTTLNNLALSSSQKLAEVTVLRYVVNLYVVGTPNGGEQGLYRFQLQPNGSWTDPQLLIGGINSMNVLYGYVNGCPTIDSSVAASAPETFSFFSSLQPTNRSRPLASIRLQLNGNTIDAREKVNASASAGQVFIYNINANIRGGNLCADRSISQ
ncbi:pilus assembly protein PilW [Neisseria sp.]|uniref:PilW family protein n=1 Tax=Neisseria sp. TaxID=192066 RepID=UPI0028A0D645|nr:pilus assembly protein PilW [Neisseria sp.]